MTAPSVHASKTLERADARSLPCWNSLCGVIFAAIMLAGCSSIYLAYGKVPVAAPARLSYRAKVLDIPLDARMEKEMQRIDHLLPVSRCTSRVHQFTVTSVLPAIALV